MPICIADGLEPLRRSCIVVELTVTWELKSFMLHSGKLVLQVKMVYFIYVLKLCNAQSVNRGRVKFRQVNCETPSRQGPQEATGVWTAGNKTTTKHRADYSLVELNPWPLCHHGTVLNSVGFSWPTALPGCLYAVYVCILSRCEVLGNGFWKDTWGASWKLNPWRRFSGFWHLRIVCQQSNIA